MGPKRSFMKSPDVVQDVADKKIPPHDKCKDGSDGDPVATVRLGNLGPPKPEIQRQQADSDAGKMFLQFERADRFEHVHFFERYSHIKAVAWINHRAQNDLSDEKTDHGDHEDALVHARIPVDKRAAAGGAAAVHRYQLMRDGPQQGHAYKSVQDEKRRYRYCHELLPPKCRPWTGKFRCEAPPLSRPHLIIWRSFCAKRLADHASRSKAVLIRPAREQPRPVFLLKGRAVRVLIGGRSGAAGPQGRALKYFSWQDAQA